MISLRRSTGEEAAVVIEPATAKFKSRQVIKLARRSFKRENNKIVTTAVVLIAMITQFKNREAKKLFARKSQFCESNFNFHEKSRRFL